MRELVGNGANGKSPARRRNTRPEFATLTVERVEHLLFDMSGGRSDTAIGPQLVTIERRLAELEDQLSSVDYRVCKRVTDLLNPPVEGQDKAKGEPAVFTGVEGLRERLMRAAAND
jgi:hypothetical protein